MGFPVEILIMQMKENRWTLAIVVISQSLIRQISFYRVTACNAMHDVAVAILCVRPSVRCVYCDKTKTSPLQQGCWELFPSSST